MKPFFFNIEREKRTSAIMTNRHWRQTVTRRIVADSKKCTAHVNETVIVSSSSNQSCDDWDMWNNGTTFDWEPSRKWVTPYDGHKENRYDGYHNSDHSVDILWSLITDAATTYDFPDRLVSWDSISWRRHLSPTCVTTMCEHTSDVI